MTRTGIRPKFSHSMVSNFDQFKYARYLYLQAIFIIEHRLLKTHL